MDKFLKRIDWRMVSSIPDFPNDFFALNLDLPWDIEKLCQNPGMSSDNLMILAKRMKESCPENIYNTCFEKLSTNPNLRLSDVISNPHLEWNWRSISSREDLQLSFVKRHLDYPWNWNMISANKNMTWEMVVENPDLPWCWFWLSDNPNITRDIIEENIHRPWDFSFLSWNQSITFDTVYGSLDKEWNWEILSRNAGFVNSLLKKIDKDESHV